MSRQDGKCNTCGAPHAASRKSFGIYAGFLCDKCAISGFRDHCGVDMPQGNPADLDEVVEPEDPSDLSDATNYAKRYADRRESDEKGVFKLELKTGDNPGQEIQQALLRLVDLVQKIDSGTLAVTQPITDDQKILGHWSYRRADI